MPRKIASTVLNCLGTFVVYVGCEIVLIRLFEKKKKIKLIELIELVELGTNFLISVGQRGWLL